MRDWGERRGAGACSYIPIATDTAVSHPGLALQSGLGNFVSLTGSVRIQRLVSKVCLILNRTASWTAFIVVSLRDPTSQRVLTVCTTYDEAVNITTVSAYFRPIQRFNNAKV